MEIKDEREFLIRLAPIYLACRWRIIGNGLIGKWPKPNMAFDFLGMRDYQIEMQLLMREIISKRSL